MTILIIAILWLFAGLALLWWLSPRVTSIAKTLSSRIAVALAAGALLGPGIIVLQEGGTVVPTGAAVVYWLTQLPVGKKILLMCVVTWLLTSAVAYAVTTMRSVPERAPS